MPKRLFSSDDETPGQGGSLLVQAPPPRVAPGNCGLCVCLQAALAGEGRGAGYPWLMGLTGAAFMLRIEPGFGPELAVTERWQHLTEALAALGYPAARLVEGDAGAEVVHAELISGRPALVLGWGNLATDWALIVGWQAGQWLGYNCEERSRRRQAAPQARLIVTLGAPEEIPEPAQAARAAIERAIPCLDQSLAQYPVWRSLLTQAEPYGAGAGQAERFHGEQWLVQCLADARDAAAEFLRSCPSAPSLFRDPLDQAAEALALVAETAEHLLLAPEFPWQKALADEAWREERLDLLNELEAAETAAAQALAASLTDQEPLPEDEDW